MPDKTAFLSVSSKDGIVEFARALAALGFRLISSTGTYKHLRAAGVPVEDIAELTGFTPMLGHKVVTLHPYLYAGLLAAPNERHELVERGYPWFDLVCCDFYPLDEAIAKPDATTVSVLQDTDIGGPTMVRAGAKARRITICDSADRERVLTWLAEGMPYAEGFLNKLAVKAEFVVMKYCFTSAKYHSGGDVDGLVGQKVEGMPVLYGENPSHSAALFKTHDHPLAVHRFTKIGGKDPSMVNLTDLARLTRTALQIAVTYKLNFGQVPNIALAAKHGNCCGAAVSMDPDSAIRRMIDSDTSAIFGGSILVNFQLGESQASLLRTYRSDETQGKFDNVIASSFTEGADTVLERVAGKCRMFTNPELASASVQHLEHVQYRPVPGGFLRQEGIPFILDFADQRMHKQGGLSEDQRWDLCLAQAICSTSNSNTITICKKGMLVANAVGQQSRVRAARLALMIAEETKNSVEGAVAAGDSFFPFPDGAVILADAGISAIFASSGSMGDAAVREALSNKVSFWQMPDKLCRGFFAH